MNLTLALTSGWFLCVIVKIMVMSIIDDTEFCVSEGCPSFDFEFRCANNGIIFSEFVKKLP